MKKISTITATKQGIIVNEKNGKKYFKKYEDSYHKKSLHKNKKVNNTVERIHLNELQRSLYRKLMYGLKEYSKEELSIMNHKTIHKVVINHEKALRFLHILKAKKYYKNETNVINAIFPNAKIGEADSEWLIPLPKKITLKKLGISTKTVIEEFIKRSLLPPDFLKLSTSKIDL